MCLLDKSASTSCEWSFKGIASSCSVTRMMNDVLVKYMGIPSTNREMEEARDELQKVPSSANDEANLRSQMNRSRHTSRTSKANQARKEVV